MKNPVLVLTATINAEQCAGLLLKDRKQREQQYALALDRYLLCGCRVVFSENSLCDFSFLSESIRNHPNVELLTFDGNHFTNICGKGQGENESITHALLNSRFLSDKEFFFKVSGRYFAREIAGIMNDFDENSFDGIFELIPANQASGNVLTVFFGVRKDFYLNTVATSAVNDSNGAIFERVMYVCINRLRIKWIPSIEYDPTMVGGSGQIVTKFAL